MNKKDILIEMLCSQPNRFSAHLVYRICLKSIAICKLLGFSHKNFLGKKGVECVIK